MRFPESRVVRRWLSLGLVLAVLAAPSFGDSEKPTTSTWSEQEQYELYKLLVDTIDQVERNYVKDVDRRELFEAAIRGVLGTLDPYSAYIGPEELRQFRSSVESEFGGIGIQIGMEDGRLKVLSPLVGTPAYRAGVVAGDWIVEIDGSSTKGISIDEAVKRLKGEPGTKVKLSVISEGASEKRSIEVARERIHIETVLGDHRAGDDTWSYLLDDKDRIGYVRLTAFSRDTARELEQALQKLKAANARGLILDLRFNPGGLLSAAIEVSDLFISKGRIVSTKGRNSPERVWDAKGNAIFESVPMVVLVNRYSASASEIVAACLQDNKRALIAGERTWGKGSVQNVIELEDGVSALKLTTASYRRPSGENIHRFDETEEDGPWGVIPDKGYELKLDGTELANLMQDRRERDIVRPRAATASADIGEDGKSAEHQPNTASGPHRTVADRQLELALKHLTAEVARAD
jgi:carboxyl-terminal processing protease